MDAIPTQYEPVFLATPNPYSNSPGILRFTSSGIGWKGQKDGQIVTIASGDIKRAQWLRVARQFRLKIILKNGTWQKLDNLQKDDFENLKELFKKLYRINLESRDISLKGSNWGKTEFQGSYLAFNTGHKTIFEVPLTDVANTNLAGKSEVSLEFLPPDRQSQSSAGMARSSKVDELVEMRFYIPGTTTASKAAKMDKSGTEGDLSGDDGEEQDAENKTDAENGEEVEEEETQNTATIFYDMVKAKADLGQTAGESIAIFQEILCLTPRGRYDIDMFPMFLRLRGKTYDYKIGYDSVVKLFLLSKPDDMHMMFIIGLDPPIRQGQTRYPFLVFQFVKDEEMDLTLNLDDDIMEEKYDGKLKRTYSDPTYQVVASVFRGLTGRSVAVTGGYHSYHNNTALKCSLKANEGHLYPLQKSFMFIPKPPTYIPHSEIGSVSFSRMGTTATGASRTFDIKFNMLSGTDIQLSSIPKEEYNLLEEYLREKNIPMKSELMDEGRTYNALDALSDESDLNDDKESGGRKRRKTTSDQTIADDFGGDDEEESTDEDFIAESSESDVPEEFDENFNREDSDDGA
ncbi:FACT complex subunit [Dispira simplex]|nr:FACT complex subunit [Dispira simplex]